MPTQDIRSPNLGFFFLFGSGVRLQLLFQEGPSVAIQHMKAERSCILIFILFYFIFFQIFISHKYLLPPNSVKCNIWGESMQWIGMEWHCWKKKRSYNLQYSDFHFFHISISCLPTLKKMWWIGRNDPI